MSLRQRRSCFHDVLSTWDYCVTCKFPVIASLNEMNLKPNADKKSFNLPQTEEYNLIFKIKNYVKIDSWQILWPANYSINRAFIAFSHIVLTLAKAATGDKLITVSPAINRSLIQDIW